VIPLRDANPTQRRPVVTWLLIGLCVAVFGLELWIQSTDGDAGLNRLFREFGLIPGRLTGSGRDDLSGAALGLFTSQFLHGGWLHLGGNMLYLWIFGNNVEDRLGRLGFLAFYLAGGVAAGLTQVAIDPSSTNPVVGASGAIAAVLGAYLVLYPGARVLSLVFLGFFYQLINVPAVVVLVLWFALQLLTGVASLGVPGVVVGLLVRAFGRRSGGRRMRSPSPYDMG
jgi:membrane associated rhomboid family serine protease